MTETVVNTAQQASIPNLLKNMLPGDKLWLRGGTYTLPFTVMKNSGLEGAPITFAAYQDEPVTIFRSGLMAWYGANWWNISGFMFDEPLHSCIYLGRHTALGYDATELSEHFTISKCKFQNGPKSGVRLNYANHVDLLDCHFFNLRPRIAGRDIVGLGLPYINHFVTARGCRFEDIGSDGIHIGSQHDKNGSDISDVGIFDCKFWVNRPYTYDDEWKNVSENGVDVKESIRTVLRGNEFWGFRPTVPGQDASGAWGAGLMVHNQAREVLVDGNTFRDNTSAITIGRDGHPAHDITVSNNRIVGCHEADNKGGWGVQVGPSTGVQVLDNSFWNNDTDIHERGDYGQIISGNTESPDSPPDDPPPDDPPTEERMAIITDLQNLEASLRLTAEQSTASADLIAEISESLRTSDSAKDSLAAQMQLVADEAKAQADLIEED